MVTAPLEIAWKTTISIITAIATDIVTATTTTTTTTRSASQDRDPGAPATLAGVASPPHRPALRG